jgi:hypothetical protein
MREAHNPINYFVYGPWCDLAQRGQVLVVPFCASALQSSITYCMFPFLCSGMLALSQIAIGPGARGLPFLVRGQAMQSGAMVSFNARGLQSRIFLFFLCLPFMDNSAWLYDARRAQANDLGWAV